MATHSSILSWRISWTEELVGYSPQGCKESDMTERLHFYAEYIMRNAKLEEAQAGIKITRRNINNLRYADDTTLWQKVKRN